MFDKGLCVFERERERERKGKVISLKGSASRETGSVGSYPTIQRKKKKSLTDLRADGGR